MRHQLSVLFVILFLFFTPRVTAQEKNDPNLDITAATGPEYDWLKPMAGHYEVDMRIWPKPGAAPIPLGTFKVTRQFVGNFLQEIMEPMPGKNTSPFSRITYLIYRRAAFSH